MNQSSFQKIWISNPTRHGNRYAWRVAGKVVGAVVLAMALLTGLTFLALWLHWPMGTVSLVVCLGITALVIWMAPADWAAGKPRHPDFLSRPGRPTFRDRRPEICPL